MPKNELGALALSATGSELLLTGELRPPESSEARTDTAAPDLALNAYKDGSTIVLQMFDKDSGEWRSVTLN